MKVLIAVALVFFILAAFFALKYFMNKQTIRQTQLNQDIFQDEINIFVESEVERSVQEISEEDILSSLLE